MRQFKKEKVQSVNSKQIKDIRLELNNFSAQDIITIDEILSIINALPDAHIAGIKNIRYDPARTTFLPSFFRRLFTKAPNYVKGVFIQNKREIVIYEFSSKPMCVHILLHEIGHFVFTLVLASHLKKEWVTTIHRKAPYVSDLAKQNANEDFAECYSMYLQQPDKLKMNDKKFTFMREHVFNHEQEQTETIPAGYFKGILIDKVY